MSTVQYLTFVYAPFLILGGFMGYVQKGSMASLLAGGGCQCCRDESHLCQCRALVLCSLIEHHDNALCLQVVR